MKPACQAGWPHMLASNGRCHTCGEVFPVEGETRRVAVYTLRIMGPEDDTESEAHHQGLRDSISDLVSKAEAAISDQLPEGYYAKIEDA